jgi:hypothetical protein
MNDVQQVQLQHVLSSVEARIRDRPDRGTLDPETVLALDIVQHALNFTHQPDALQLFREALWERTVADRTKAAVTRMMEHIVEATDRGEVDAASKICNCLETVTDPDIFRGGLPDQFYRAMTAHS